MNSNELREKFLDFFKERGHAVVPSSSLIPDDPSVLLTTAGMQQFKPYFIGRADPVRDFGSKNTASVQKSFRTSDIDEVGDESHLTFFEMLGNFSFGGYFKKEAIQYGYDFITREIGLPIEYVSVFEGDSEVPADTESEEIWKALGVTNIKKLGREDNFWGPTGSEGPCGPTTEIYVKSAGGKDIEVWNIVFNEFYCNPDKTLRKLETPGVDTGMGLERLAMVSQGVPTIFDTDLFRSVMALLPEAMDIRRKRIFADHVRGVAFLIADSVRPSNKDSGYVLRRLMRRIIVYGEKGINIKKAFEHIVREYSSFYKNLTYAVIEGVFDEEYQKFSKTLRRGLRELHKQDMITAESAFMLYESYGIPYEIIKEEGGEHASALKRENFDKEFERHQEASRKGQEKKFGGHGLILNTGELKAANDEEVKKVTRLHTATHLLQASLRKVLGGDVQQAGSDITAERTRFDFTFPRKVTQDELQQIEDMANKVVEGDFDVIMEEMAYEDAIRNGALAFFKEKYPERVSVYSVVKDGEVFSRELCGGPHVRHTGEIGKITITKEESSSAGVRRIRAIIEP
ncbi:MAG: alanine--tRNA ligase [Candidatus Niyogibacteria bacterium CG10_big_fil_rev_8_21_14_0_10_46_36]|uniref:alanine--tRNA ligase n=1 Tax=Candidatus Niyogibacteria bacterium CG10_big_fil_rev_8_21_14_0_10_46_36 TaxID=1974726 RepID=A0A2H0TGF8_9BACT|nr:MAG: alanine--tRNA ligase [Candidatus Niyogibacteria bacterium CG10_big_fil_rev_8_21_14_0_10_46_36]